MDKTQIQKMINSHDKELMIAVGDEITKKLNELSDSCSINEDEAQGLSTAIHVVKKTIDRLIQRGQSDEGLGTIYE